MRHDRLRVELLRLDRGELREEVAAQPVDVSRDAAPPAAYDLRGPVAGHVGVEEEGEVSEAEAVGCARFSAQDEDVVFVAVCDLAQQLV